MNEQTSTVGIVLVADVVASRADYAGSSVALRALARELNGHYRDERLASFDYTQGDELQGVLTPTADPFAAVLLPALAARPLRMRWAIVRGSVVPGRGPATRRSGAAFVGARAAITEAARTRVGLLTRTGDGALDGLLADLCPLLPVLLEDLSVRQREIARLMLIDGLRQSEVAKQLALSRPTVSVAHARGRIDRIAGLVRALRALFAADGLHALSAVTSEATPGTGSVRP